MYISIQACRAIAALLVLGYHLAGNLAKDRYFGAAAAGMERVWYFGGSAGVSFFFVLSGFIMLLVHRQDLGQPARLPDYARKRLVRIFPSYLIVFAGVYLLARAVPALRDTVPTDPVVIAKALLLLPQDPAVVGGTGAPVIVVAWSLQYELVFYAALGLAIVHRGLFALVLALFALNFGWQAQAGTPRFPGSFFASHLMLLFGLGMAAAWVVQQQRWLLRQPLRAAAVAGVLFLGVGVAADLYREALPKPLVDLGYGLFSAVGIVALVQAERARPARFAWPWATPLGDASYALYLIHFPLIAVLCKLAVGLGLRGVAGAALAFVAIGAACIVVAVLFHRWIERPLLRRLSGRPRPVHAAAVSS